MPGRQRHEDVEFEASKSYIARTCLLKRQKKEKKGRKEERKRKEGRKKKRNDCKLVFF